MPKSPKKAKKRNVKKDYKIPKSARNVNRGNFKELVLLAASLERFSVSRIRDFLTLFFLPSYTLYIDRNSINSVFSPFFLSFFCPLPGMSTVTL